MDIPEEIIKAYHSDDISYFMDSIKKDRSDDNIKKVLNSALRHGVMWSMYIVGQEPELEGPIPTSVKIKTLLNPTEMLRTTVKITKKSIHDKLKKLESDFYHVSDTNRGGSEESKRTS